MALLLDSRERECSRSGESGASDQGRPRSNARRHDRRRPAADRRLRAGLTLDGRDAIDSVVRKTFWAQPLMARFHDPESSPRQIDLSDHPLDPL
jgi:hypothetical protein